MVKEYYNDKETEVVVLEDAPNRSDAMDQAIARAQGQEENIEGKNNAEVSSTKDSNQESGGGTDSSAETVEKSSSQLRKEAILAAKLAQSAKAEQKKAKDMADKADKFNKQIGNWKENPAKVLEEAGISPQEFYQAMSVQYLNGSEPDPVEEKVKASVQPYIQALENEKQSLAQERANRQTAADIAQHVLPIVSDEEKYQSLLASCGGDTKAAAMYVHNARLEHYQKHGEVISPQEVADALESYHDNLIQQALDKLPKKFKSIEKKSESLKVSPSYKEQPTKTLSSKGSIVPQGTPKKEKPEFLSSSDDMFNRRLENFLKKFQ